MNDKPIRIRLSRQKGWKMPPNTVKVDRSTRWGNPFNFKSADCCWIALSYGCRGDAKGRQEASVKAFRRWVDPTDGRQVIHQTEQAMLGTMKIGPQIKVGKAPTLTEIIENLRGKNLACWCALDAPCHADILLEFANAPEPK